MCPVCGGGSLRFVQRFHSFSLQHCDRCGVQHWNPLEHPGPEFYEDERVSIYRDLHEGKERPDDPRFARVLRELPNLHGIRALDIGCSDGAFLAQLQSRGNEVWGIDIDAKALAVARNRGLSNIQRAEVPEFVESARQQGLTFDLITAFDVIEHLADPVTAIRALGSLLQPGGRFVGTVPNRRRLLANSMPIDFPPHHFYRFDEPSMRETVRRAGLVPDQVDAFQYNYAMATVLNKVLKAVRPVCRVAARQGTRTALSRRTGKKRRLLRAYEVMTAPLSFALERPWQRGFKLFFVGRRP